MRHTLISQISASTYLWPENILNCSLHDRDFIETFPMDYIAGFPSTKQMFREALAQLLLNDHSIF